MKLAKHISIFLTIFSVFIYAQTPKITTNYPHQVSSKTGNSVISGRLLSITPDGIIQLETAHTQKPIRLDLEALAKIQLSQSQETPNEDPIFITLTSGETLSGQTLSLDKKTLHLETQWGGSLKVPRQFVAESLLNLSHEKTLYSGPKPTDNWAHAGKWTISDGSMKSSESGSASLLIDLPDRFIFSSSISWSKGSQVKFIFFNTPAQNTASASRYELVFFDKTIEFHRYEQGQSQPLIIGTHYRTAKRFGNNQVATEFYIDRKQREFHLFLAGEKEATFRDPSAKALAPSGGLSVVFDNEKHERVTLSKMLITTWNAQQTKLDRNGYAESKNDIIIAGTGSRFSGEVSKITMNSQGKHSVDFIQPPSQKLNALPLQRISKIIFAENEQKPIPSREKDLYKIVLNNGDFLHTSHFHWSEKKLTTEHPALGEISLPSENVLSIIQLDTVN